VLSRRSEAVRKESKKKGEESCRQKENCTYIAVNPGKRIFGTQLTSAVDVDGEPIYFTKLPTDQKGKERETPMILDQGTAGLGYAVISKKTRRVMKKGKEKMHNLGGGGRDNRYCCLTGKR